MKRLILFAILSATYAFAYPYSATCPYDGATAMFSHVVGYGANSVCWYKHTGWQNGRSVTHEFYQSCPQ